MKAADIDYLAMTSEELDEVIKQATKAKETIHDRKRAEAAAAAKKLAEEYGISFEELVQGITQSGKGKVSKGTPKYANPDDQSKTWTGRGRKPDWVTAHLDAGGDLEELAIKAA